MYGNPTKQKEIVRVKPHVKKNDMVLILTGKDRGKQGKVLRVNATKGTAIVERANMMKKHTKANPQKNVSGGVLEREAPIKLSNLQVVCPSCDKPTRTGSHRTAEGSARYCKKCDTEM
ncbi:MAG TPA: 50S ribosomal protein L24 [Thermoanaerobaculia bacterium]|jgi:large subunit ribosomal protein L24|nr:50S ribosomal protein L24 [Thermoanaerobaculia bacterium]